MAIFEVEHNGEIYEVDAPDEEAAAAAFGPGPASQQALAGMQSEPQQFPGNAVEQKRARRAARIEEEFNAQPGWKRGLTTLIDLPSLIAQGGSFGLLDKAAAAARAPFTDKTYEEELRENRRQTEEARARQGWAGTAAELTGAIGSGSLLTKGAIKGLTKVAPGALTTRVGAAFAPVVSTAPKAPRATRALNTAIRGGLASGEGAAYGATSAFGADQDISEGAGMGALFGLGGRAAGDLLVGGLNKVAGRYNKPPASTTRPDQLPGMISRAYDKADAVPGIFDAASFSQLRDDIIADMADQGFLKANQPGVHAALEELDRLNGQNITYKGLEQSRRAIRGGYNPLNKDNNRMIKRILDKLEDYATSKGSDLYPEARELATRGFKVDALDDALKLAQDQAGSTWSGGNINNAIRQRVRKVKQSRNDWTPDEARQLDEIVHGTLPSNAARLVGKLSPTGSGLMSALQLGAGFFAHAPAAIGTAAVGYGAKTLGDRMTKSAVAKLRDIAAAGGQARRLVPPDNAFQRMTKAKRAAIRRALMLGMNNQYNQPAER